jgi:hypothetical protein
MNPKNPRPTARPGEHRTMNSEDSRGSSVPNAHTRIVYNRNASFIYIPCCPLCGLEHAHGLFPYPHGNPLQAYDSCDGYRVSHCFAQGLGRVAKMIRGEWCTVHRRPPPEYQESEGHSYRLILGPEPACFTRRGIRSADARAAMARLTGVSASLQILKPRRAFILERGD